MLGKKEMLCHVRDQLAIDYNCSSSDFLKDGFIFTPAKKNEGRRPWPWVMPRLEMVTMGCSVIINASADILPLIRRRLEGKTRYEALNMPFIYGVNPYYLPDPAQIPHLQEIEGYTYALVEKDALQRLLVHKGMPTKDCPDLASVVTTSDHEIAGIASTTVECAKLSQIHVEVYGRHRGRGLAATMVNALTFETLDRGFIPYYSTDCSNVLSQRVAIRAGYFPAWVHCFRTRLDALADHNAHTGA